MCSDGRMDGASTSEPIATCTYSPSRTTEKSSEPQTAQRVSFASSSPTISSWSAPARDRELLPLDAREGLERCSGRGAAPRAVAVRCVQKRVRYLVAHSPARAGSRESVRVGRQRLAPRRRCAGRAYQSRDMKNVGTSQMRRNATSSEVDAPWISNVNPSTRISTRQKMR